MKFYKNNGVIAKGNRLLFHLQTDLLPYWEVCHKIKELSLAGCWRDSG